MFFLNNCNWHAPRKMSITCRSGKGCVCVHVCAVAQCCPTLQPHGGCRGLQVPLSMGFSRQGYWSELRFLIPENLPNPGIEPVSPESPALAGTFLILCHLGSQQWKDRGINYVCSESPAKICD